MKGNRAEMSFLCRAGRHKHTLFDHKKIYRISSPGRQLLHRSVRIEKTSLLQGSMTVEASVILPCFLFFFINLSSSLEMIRLQSNVQYALHKAGNEVCLYGSLLTEELKEMGPAGHGGSKQESAPGDAGDEADQISELITGMLLSQTYVRSAMESELTKTYLEESPLKNGPDSFDFAGSLFDENDIVDIRLTYGVETPIKWISPAGFSMPARFYGHLWNGYELEGGGLAPVQEQIVYITDDSEVYHVTTTCTHLKLSIRPVSYADVSGERNTGGARYYPCEVCASGSAPDVVYVGSWGDRYHYLDDCYTLTRSYTAVPLSEVEDSHRPCMRCGK